ncbi:serine/threonine protein kinase [Nocardioides albertanoniae]|uniref:Serine/threonine protein kinase n=2 Tax=Nocardioides albertanoniae TaxID=1175486 RepID=A0A543AA73_9ACTN|nr:serine/threonine protein kinase [Nocardioides albertanoniae]
MADRDSIGDYDLLSEIGQGGMGRVHLASHRGSGERVALKVLRTQFVSDDEGRRRLAREVSSLQRVYSRWVAGVVGADPWGEVAWLATRYVPGPTLHDKVLREGPLPRSVVEQLAGDLAEGIADCHAVGVLHRDIKPANIILEGATPILIDFGLARVAEDPKITVTGVLIGTPGYLPPEIAVGDPATPASDVHSWASVVTYAATGRAPFGDGNAMKLMDRARRGDHDLDGVPQPLRGVLAQALAPDPADRPTLEELREWLRTPRRPFARKPAERLSLSDRAERAKATTPLLPQPALPASGAAALSRHPGLEKLRRGALWLGLLAFAAGVVAAWPGLGLLTVLGVAGLIRAGTLAAGDLRRWRWYRGRKWHDAPRLLIGAPWRLVRAVPKTVLLGLWGYGFVVAATLIGFALQLSLEATLALAGLSFVIALWRGSGRDRLRDPVARVVHRVSARWVPWILGFAVVVVLAVFPMQTLAAEGPQFAGGDEPWWVELLGW